MRLVNVNRYISESPCISRDGSSSEEQSSVRGDDGLVLGEILICADEFAFCLKDAGRNVVLIRRPHLLVILVLSLQLL